MKNILIILSFLFHISKCSLLDKQLQETCGEDSDCSVAYSYCSDQKKCDCIDGFQQNLQGLCSWKQLYCPPIDDVEQEAGDLCEITYNPRDTSQIQESCPRDQFCYPHPNSRSSESGTFTFSGHCCPRPEQGSNGTLGLACPLTQAFNGTCPDYSMVPADIELPPELHRTCPYSTHDCVSQPMRKDQICCPVPCRGGVSSHFEIEGRCYDTVWSGNPCQHSAQCAWGYKCRKSDESNTEEKRCTCMGKLVEGSPPSCLHNDSVEL